MLSSMEGAVMQARTFRDIETFDGAVRQLRNSSRSWAFNPTGQ